jgi:pyridoxal phosphate enzyme (YggS family)
VWSEGSVFEDVAARLRQVQSLVTAAAERAGRTDSVTVVAVTKTVPPERVQAVYDAGHHVFGENRVQEAVSKIESLRVSMPDARWHLIGHLQSNKVKQATEVFSLIESVDSLRLASALDERARRVGRVLPVLLEVNVAGEQSKSGFRESDLWLALPELLALSNLDVCGLMTVAPLVQGPEEVRWVFRRLRELRDRAQDRGPANNVQQLSMGMSGDFEVAVEEGATIVRIGRAIFGERVAGGSRV